MKNNYYTLKNKKRNYKTRKKTNYNKKQTNFRKRQAKQLNYKKLFFTLISFILIIYLLSILIGKFTNKETIDTSTNMPKSTTINMAVIGDIMCHSTNFQDAYDKTTTSYDFSYVFSDIEDYIKNADISIGNLETTFSGKKVGYTGYPTFNTPEELAKNLSDIGLDIVSTANNHSLDKRYNGLVSTLDELDKVGINHTGTYRSKEEQNSVLIKDINGIKIAFLSFTYGTNGIPIPQGKEYCVNLIDENLIMEQLNIAKTHNPDIICVNMHWGDEYKLVQNTTQEQLADMLFKNGVDIILGSHPHVLQPMEKRTITLDNGTTKDGFIIYSLGNFMSGQVIENTRNSIILQLQITKHPDKHITIDSYNYVPIYMQDLGNGSENRYKILDINTLISKYEENDSNKISENLYDTLIKSRDKIKDTLTYKK